MAINTQKLLPSSKKETTGTGIISNKKSSIVLSQTSVKNITIIKVKTIQIESILKGTLASEKKSLDQKKRKESAGRRERQEEKLETKPNLQMGQIKMPSAPKLGIFDWIKNFIGNIVLGYFAVRLIKYLPKIVPIIKLIGQATDFAINLGGKLLDGLTTFIDWGYKAYDATRGFIKQLGGENFAQGFDKFIGAVDTALFLTSVLAADLALEAMTGGGPTGIDPSQRPKPGQGAKPKVTTSGGKPVGRPDIRSPFRQRPTVTLGKGGSKAILGTVRPLVKRLPIIGALLDFGLSVALGEDPGRAAFKAIGAGLVGAVGTAIGSLAFGAGAVIGGIIGGIGGDMLGGALYDMFFGGKKPKPKGKVEGKAGGGVTRGGKVQGGVKREIGGKKKKKTLAQKPTETQFKTTDKRVKEVSQDLDKTKYFGPVLAVSAKILENEKPTAKDYENVGLGINLLISKGIEEKQLRGGLIAAFAEGGMVDADFIEAAEKGSDISNWIAKTFQGEIESKVEKNLRLIRERKEKETSPPPLGIPLGEGATASGRSLMQGLIQRGFTKEEAAAIVGNLWAESGFRTTATNPTSGAFGLMQWLGGRKSRLYSYAAEKGKQVTDINLQLDYIKWELKGGNAYETEQFKKAMNYGSDVASKTKGFAEQVERAGAGELRSSMSKRIGAAESVYGGKMVAGETPSTGGSYTQLSNNLDAKRGSKLAGELGRFLDKRGLGSFGSGVHQHPEHPPWSPESGHSQGSLHYASQGARAIDIGGYGRSRGYDDQDKILSAVYEFNKIKGIKPIQLLKDGYPGHDNHVHVAYAKGGRVRRPTYTLLGERGPEFVFDADTTSSLDMFAPGLLERLNIAKTKPEVASILQSYTSYEQPYGQPEIVEVPVPVPMPIFGEDNYASSDATAMSGGEESDYFDSLYVGG